MNGYERRTQQKRKAIIQAAQELFIKRGITGVTVNEIAVRAGVSQVTVFKYFGDKMTLAREAMMERFNESMAAADELLEQNIPFSEKIQWIIDKNKQSIDIVGESFLHSIDDPPMKQIINEFLTVRAVPWYEKLIKEGKKEGAIDESIPTEAIMAYIFALLPVLSSPEHIKKGREYYTGLMKLFFNGLISK
ncbi:TetR/AcrR family transcriptional regulator [Paenactinomyces guangxiensis]|uniref:TetR/AcrR family transcriptional regulator n=1 Tax=Paenactinomyces guangxiensis TaxID=1490290 RepID=A0A7W1WRX0_9BACL|nr:TetR/AcrR family transcriptional regulator [Paenactinomyces guangxiensis]MBA4494834.1 TetR/AcrR family transcriptional regulator [Paenactinomyces guangxiensis]MBH8591917.1 TetR/AcrR family transcriptional regulator [Paenactinomyces guangxiensis]